MINPTGHKLDNPVWHALSGPHVQFSIDYNSIKFYQPGYCPFGAVNSNVDVTEALIAYANLTGNFFIVGGLPVLPKGFSVKNELVCLQMIIVKPVAIAHAFEQITNLDESHQDELYKLVNLVQPGYFRRQTALLGDYYGLFVDKKLVAVAGERMKLEGFTEVSAIVTHPQFTGRGYGAALTAHCVNNIISKNEAPFLHVLENNAKAIRLYERCGFTTRRTISFWNIGKH